MKPGCIIRKSRFHESLIEHNNLNKLGFKEWIFYPGMLFNHLHKWWTDRGIRHKPHEGIDLCFYRDENGQVHNLSEETHIPVMYNGEIVHIGNDLLGKSLYVNHNIYNNNGNKLYTIYGHASPYYGIDIGKILNEGDVIATIAPIRKKTKIFPHLHISTAWLPESFPYEKLDWETINDCNTIILCDPLEFINCNYKIEQSSMDAETF